MPTNFWPLRPTLLIARSPLRHRFSTFCLATGRHSQFAAEQTFAALAIVSGHTNPCDFESQIVLEYSRNDFVQPAKKVKSPVNRQSAGAIRFLSETDLAAYIMFDMVENQGGNRNYSVVKKVVLQRLHFADLSLRRLRVAGRKGDPVVVSAQRQVARRRRARQDFATLLDNIPLHVGGAAHEVQEDDTEATINAGEPAMPIAQELGIEGGLEDIGEEDDMIRSFYSSLCDSSSNDNVGALVELAGEQGDVQGDLDPEEDDLAEGHAQGAGEQGDEDIGGGEGAADGEPAPANPWGHLQVREVAGHTFCSNDDNKQLGRVHYIGVDGGTKATCQQHRGCVCWLNGRVARDAATPDLVQWLSMRVTLDERRAAGRAIKLRHGMRVRSSS